MVKDFLRAPGSHTGETVGNNLHVEIPLTNCKVLYQEKKNRALNVLCVLRVFVGVVGRRAPRRKELFLLLSYLHAPVMHATGIS